METEPKLRQLTEEDKQEEYYKDALQNVKIGRARADVVRLQIITAYKELEGIRFDYVADTAFRDKITKAKRGLESALSDFLMRNEYWEEREKSLCDKSPKEYWDYMHEPQPQPDQTSKLSEETA